MTEYKHPNDMTWQELRDIVSDYGWALIELKEDLQYAEYLLQDGDLPMGLGRVQSAVRSVEFLKGMPYNCLKKPEPGPEPLYRYDKHNHRYVEVEQQVSEH